MKMVYVSLDFTGFIKRLRTYFTTISNFLEFEDFFNIFLYLNSLGKGRILQNKDLLNYEDLKGKDVKYRG